MDEQRVIGEQGVMVEQGVIGEQGVIDHALKGERWGSRA
jgi:hypothetical protein